MTSWTNHHHLVRAMMFQLRGFWEMRVLKAAVHGGACTVACSVLGEQEYHRVLISASWSFCCYSETGQI